MILGLEYSDDNICIRLEYNYNIIYFVKPVIDFFR